MFGIWFACSMPKLYLFSYINREGRGRGNNTNQGYMRDDEEQLRAKKILFPVVAIIIAITVFLGAIELTTRTVSWLTGKGFVLALHELEPYDRAIESIYRWHPFTGIIFRPNNRFWGSHPNSKKKALIFVDKHGFLAKDQTLEYEKPENEIRIATIGASTTANLNLSFEENWPGYLGMLVQKAIPNRYIRVINAAVPGFDTAQSIGNLSLRVIPFNPDVVIIYHAYNDLKAVRPNSTFKPDYSHFHTKPYGYHKKPNVLIRSLHSSMFYVRTRNEYREYREKRKRYEELTRKEGSKGRLSYFPLEAVHVFEQHVRSLVSIAKAEGAIVIVSSFAILHEPNLDWSSSAVLKHLTEFQRRDLYSLLHFTPGLTLEAVFKGFKSYNRVLERLALQEKIGWVDNASLIPHEDSYFVDRVHFSGKGAKRMAQNLLPVVLRELKHRNLLGSN
jgi:lysophospholipase L1-like esterase